MKLKQLRIKIFRGLKGDNNIISFDDNDINFLIGPNNVGKSTYSEAYDFFINTKTTFSIDDFTSHSTGITREIEIEAWYVISKYSAAVKSSCDYSNEELYWFNKWADSDTLKIMKVWHINKPRVKTYYIKNKLKNLITDQYFSEYLVQLAPYPIFIEVLETFESFEKKINRIIYDVFLKPVKEKEEFTKEADEIVQKINDLQQKIFASELITEINQSMKDNFELVFNGLNPILKEKDKTEINILDSFKKNHSIRIQKSEKKVEEDFKQHRHGVYRLILFNFLKSCFSCAGPNSSLLILMDEPELFLYPSAVIKFRKSLYQLAEKTNIQFLCTTHSPLMINLSNPHTSLVGIKKDMNTDITETINLNETLFDQKEELKNYVKMINYCNPHFCEVFFADRVLVVEGYTEVIVFRYLIDHFFGDKNIFIVHAEGKK